MVDRYSVDLTFRDGKTRHFDYREMHSTPNGGMVVFVAASGFELHVPVGAIQTLEIMQLDARRAAHDAG